MGATLDLQHPVPRLIPHANGVELNDLNQHSLEPGQPLACDRSACGAPGEGVLDQWSWRRTARSDEECLAIVVRAGHCGHFWEQSQGVSRDRAGTTRTTGEPVERENQTEADSAGIPRTTLQALLSPMRLPISPPGRALKDSWRLGPKGRHAESPARKGRDERRGIIEAQRADT